MKDAQLDDLKQFILAVVSQSETNMKQFVKQYVQTELTKQIGELRNEMRQGFATIAEILTSVNDDLADHDRRITTIEHKLA